VVESIGRRWSGRVEVTSGEARWERTFEGESCATVADAVALTVSLSIARSQALTTVEPAPARTVGALVASELTPAPASKIATAAPAAPQAVLPADTVPSPSSTHMHSTFSVNAEGVIDVGSLPSPSPGGALGATWRAAPIEIGVGATAVEGQRATVAGSSSGASVSLTAASATVCLIVPIGDRVVAAPCAGGAVERLAAHGFGAAQTFVATQPVVVLGAAVAEAKLEWSPMSALAVRASARGLAPWSRPTFVVRRVVSPKHVGRRRARGSHRGNISRLRGVRYR
jgi:hypothetical protein